MVQGGPLTGPQFDNPPVLRVMQRFFARAGVTARFSVAAGADERNAERDQPIAQLGWFTRGEDEADIGKHEAKGANQLHQLTVAQVGERLKFPGARAQPGQGDRQLGFPAIAQQIASTLQSPKP